MQDERLTPEVDILVFECPKCKTVFNQHPTSQISQPQNSEPTTADLIEKLIQIQNGLKKNLATLRSNLGFLETKCSGALFELENLRRDSESKAYGLEEDVNRLREEIQGLKDALGLSSENA